MIDKEIAQTFDRRSALFLTGGAILTSALVMRMLQMQVFNYGDYKRKSENNSFRVSVNIAERGKIFAANGATVSRDAPVYRIYIVAEEADDAETLVHTVAAELKLRQTRISRIIARMRRTARFMPVLISENSDWKTLAGLAAQNLAGLHIRSGFARIYDMGPAGAQMFGYVGAPTRPVANAPFWTTGISGLEKTFNNTLAGTAGQSVMTANALGRIIGEDKTQYVPSQPGGDIKTTINESVQRKLYDALVAQKSGCGVVIDIKTGDIVAMASAPSFDPNIFRNDDGDEYMETLRDDFTKPFMNKAVEGLYPPGSTFKIVVALAALESGATTATEKIFCPGYWDYGDRRYHCWEHGGHGNMNLADALKHSCDIYFYQMALRIGIDSIKEMGVRLGLSEKYLDGILPIELAGILPDRKWKEDNKGARWLHGDTIISGIGQGFILSNCLELATMMARVAGNKIIIPKLIQSPATSHQPLNIQQKNIDLVLKGLESVMQTGGTAAGFAINVGGKKMGGKTGTSQVRSVSRAERESGQISQEELKWAQRNHGLFVGFAPIKNPRYAICTITEHSGTSGPAVKAAADTMREVLK